MEAKYCKSGLVAKSNLASFFTRSPPIIGNFHTSFLALVTDNWHRLLTSGSHDTPSVGGTHDLLYADVRQRSSDGVHTFEDRKRERSSRTNIADEDNRSRPQGRVVEQVDEDKCQKW
jgi:hypothetical protein